MYYKYLTSTISTLSIISVNKYQTCLYKTKVIKRTVMATAKKRKGDNKGLALSEEGTVASAKGLVKFVTGNVNKLKEVLSILESDGELPVTLDNVKLNLPELQVRPLLLTSSSLLKYFLTYN